MGSIARDGKDSTYFSMHLIQKNSPLLVHEGEALFHIAHYDMQGVIAKSVEAFQDEHDPLSDDGSIRERPVIV